MGNKVSEYAVKIYKPEILICPKCKGPIKYKYTISNKVVQFTSGKVFRIKNLGYGCLNCNDGNIYFSQTANKLCFKGYTYSAKIVCMIDYYKKKHYSRERICDILASKGVDISDRNIDILYKKFNEYYNQDYDSIINLAYENMLKKFNEIRIALDFITINEKIYIILYDYFNGDKLAIWILESLKDEEIINTISKYINDKITIIATVRPNTRFFSIVKKLSSNARYISFNKF